VIGLPGNVVLIGRSGTGKTTTSILRLFALETVYRIKKLKKTDKQAKVKAEHLD
jgi:ABC-type phosphate/phosphonate transport system ATPase subunit